jgi:hypothetical protein
MIERVMLLDAVLDDREFAWLGPSYDKRRHFVRLIGNRMERLDYPHLVFGEGPQAVVRFFPDKLPLGVHPETERHVFVYLVTRPSPVDFRQFLLRHALLLRALRQWTIRLLLPRKLVKARLAYLHVAREHLASPLHPKTVEALEPLFAERKRLAAVAGGGGEATGPKLPGAYAAPLYRALYRQWLIDPRNTIWMAGSNVLADALDRGEGRVECVELSRQYLHLSPLVAVA